MDRTIKACRTSLCIFGFLASCANTAVASTPAYSFDADARRLVLSAHGAIHCASSPNGFLTLTSEGLVHSSDPASPHYAAVLKGVTNETLREIQVSGAPTFSIGPFTGQRLTLTSTHAVELTDALSLTDALTVSAPGITVNGDVRVPGAVDGAGASRGGDIRVLGERITVGAAARVSASGASGGGRILLGGDLRGGNNVPTAAITRIASGALIHADALASGDGGRVIVWADDATTFQGHISARGGTHAGHGGFVEVSGKAQIDFLGTVDTSAPHGDAGTLLLDPANITIQATSPDINGDMTPGDDITNPGALDDAVVDFNGANSVITDGALQTVLQSGNVILAATNDITLGSVIDLNLIGANPRTLTFNAGRNITIMPGGGFSATGATTSLNVVLNTDADNNSSGRYLQQGNIGTNGGNVTIVARDAAIPIGAQLQADIATNGGDIIITGTGQTTDVRVATGADLSAGAGNITLTGNRISIEASTSLAGTGNLTVQPLTAATAMLVGGAGSTVTDFLTTAEIAEIDNGFAAITVGRANSSGALAVAASGVTFSDPLVLRSPNGAINVNGVITATGGAGITFSGPVTTGVVSAAMNGASVLFQDSLAINGTSAGSLAVTGNVVFGPTATFQLTANGAAPGQFDALSVTGSVTLGGTLAPTFAFTPQLGDTVLFVSNDAADIVAGSFTNQPPGSLLIGTGVVLEHTLGDGNDVGFVVPETIFRNGYENDPGANLTVPGDTINRDDFESTSADMAAGKRDGGN